MTKGNTYLDRDGTHGSHVSHNVICRLLVLLTFTYCYLVPFGLFGLISTVEKSHISPYAKKIVFNVVLKPTYDEKIQEK